MSKNKALKLAPEIQEVVKKLQTRPANISLADISRSTGLAMGWLSMFHQGRIPDPSYTRLTVLIKYLSKI